MINSDYSELKKEISDYVQAKETIKNIVNNLYANILIISLCLYIVGLWAKMGYFHLLYAMIILSLVLIIPLSKTLSIKVKVPTEERYCTAFKYMKENMTSQYILTVIIFSFLTISIILSILFLPSNKKQHLELKYENNSFLNPLKFEEKTSTTIIQYPLIDIDNRILIDKKTTLEELNEDSFDKINYFDDEEYYIEIREEITKKEKIMQPIVFTKDDFNSLEIFLADKLGVELIDERKVEKIEKDKIVLRTANIYN